MAATSQLAQTTLRSVLGKHELDEMLAERDSLYADIQEILDKQTDVWGIKVTTIEIKDIDLNETMVRAIAKHIGLIAWAIDSDHGRLVKDHDQFEPIGYDGFHGCVPTPKGQWAPTPDWGGGRLLANFPNN